MRKRKARYGYRHGIPEVQYAERLIKFEVRELGNTHLIKDTAKALKVKPKLSVVLAAIRKRFGPKAEAVWICRTRMDALRYASYGPLLKMKIPKKAVLASDLGPDGQLWIAKTFSGKVTADKRQQTLLDLILT